MRTRSQAGGGIGKRVHRKARTVKEPSDSWELLDRQGLDPYADDEGMEDREQEQSPAIESPVDVDEAINPLREMAERVGREVELFAETLDQFFEELPTVANRYDAAHDLILSFKRIADMTVDDMKKNHEREMREQLKREWSERARIPAASAGLAPFTYSGSTSLSAKKAEQVKQLRQWQQEADLWELFRIMLELHPFEADAQAMRAEKEEKLAKLGPPHRYTAEGDLWERFLLENDLARERNMIKTWLEQTAEHQAGDVQGIVEELEAKAGRGKGLWSSGWLHTREKIKGEKRLRNWPNAADSPLPQIRRSDNNELLVTTLDPDAPRRQQRTLEKPDVFLERAIWVACWEMLRRGKSFQEICDWCEERKEGWRALCMGKALDGMEPATSSAAWRHMCKLMSQSDCSSIYEAAVFGLLGGNIKAMERICHTIDDHLYAYYSATLLRQFDHYVSSTCPDKAMPPAWRRNLANDSVLDPEQAQQAISDLIVRLRRDKSTSSEASQPMKLIQSFLLADEVGSLIHTVGAAIAETDALRGSEEMLFFRNQQDVINGKLRGEVEVALDPQTLRIAAHMSIIHRILSPEYLEGDELREDENVLVAYIQALRTAGKRTLIPTYASKLSKERYISVLGRVLQDVTAPQEQIHMVRMLQDADLDVIAILQEQLAWVMDTSFDGEYAEKPLSILEPTKVSTLHPGQKINVDFLPAEVTTDDEAIVRSLQWFRLLRGGWDVTFKALTLALRRCLGVSVPFQYPMYYILLTGAVTGRFASARLIVAEFPYEKLSQDKSYETLGRSVNIMDDNAFTPHDEEEYMTWDLMKRQSRTYYELEQLIQAVEVLAAWRIEEQKCEGMAQKPPGMQAVFKEVKEKVSLAMEALLRGVLQNPIDEQEAEDLAHIRLTYLPEIIVGYTVILHAAGPLVSREALLESMDLSTTIATERIERDEEESNGLAECFVKAGRMRELVTIFALTSKSMLVTKAVGRPWKPNRKDRVGRDLGVWEIGSAGARPGA